MSLLKATNVIYDDEKERFILLRSQSIALATVASKTYKTFEVFKECLLNAEEKIQQATRDPEVVGAEDPGRKRKNNEEQNNLECGICNGAHETGRCPFKEEMKRFAPPGSTTEGPRHCKLCGYSGHNAASCPAKRAWLEYKISNCNLPNIES